jgi:hypothetical protein
MIVVIPSPEPRCPALDALEMEGVDELHLALCTAPTDYGRVFSEYWNRGEPFIVCEWDICPWPEAIDKLSECNAGWCAHRYPLHRGNVTLSFGLGKYRPQGEAPAEWAQTRWDQLDGQVIPVLNRLYGKPHVHEPPVAHARREVAP